MDEKDANNNLAAEENNAPIQEESIWSQNPTSTPTPNSDPAPIIEKPKKKKLGLIITLCALAVLLIGGGVFAALYLSWRQSDEVVIVDAISGAIKKSKIAIGGSAFIDFNESNQSASGLKSIRVVFDSASNSTESRGDGTLVFVKTDGNETGVTIGSAFISDGTIYMKIKGIKDAIEALDLPAEAETIIEYLEELIEDIDGQWYKITAADLSFSSDVKDLYNCAVDAINYAVSDEGRGELANLYIEHPFIISNKQHDKDENGNAVYGVKWDANYLADFMNNIQDTKIYEKVESCSDLTETSSKTFTPEDFEIPKDFPEIKLHIDPWSHELRGLSTSYSKDGNSFQTDITFLYDDKVNVEIPSDAKSVGDLMDSIEDAIKKVVSSMIEQQAISNCGNYTGVPYNDCISAYSTQIQYYLDQMDLKDLFSITTGNRV